MFFQKKSQLTTRELQEKLKNKAVLIDVREVGEYASGHIPGAINVPLDILAVKVMDVVGSKSDEVIVHCLSGGRSAQAARILKDAGYTNVHDFGGIHRYEGDLK
ncbi:MAG: rhodanese-like domain-containing protein [Erysipelotrichaceae bacterium]